MNSDGGVEKIVSTWRNSREKKKTHHGDGDTGMGVLLRLVGCAYCLQVLLPFIWLLIFSRIWLLLRLFCAAYSFVFGLCAYEMFYKRLICIIINIVCKYKVLFYTLD